MTPSPEEREQFALRSLTTAEGWRRNGEARWELNVLSSSVKALLGAAVERFADAMTGIRFLEDKAVPSILGRMAQLNAHLLGTLHRDGKPTAGAVDNQITPVHVAWLLGCWGDGRTLLAACVDEVVCKFFPLTGFWAEYHRAIDCLASGRVYEPVAPRVRGYENYWVPYLKLVSDLSNGRPIESSRDEIAKSFETRNRDKRLTDWEMIDGDGKHPVRWDFREASIMKFAKHREACNV